MKKFLILGTFLLCSLNFLACGEKESLIFKETQIERAKTFTNKTWKVISAEKRSRNSSTFYILESGAERQEFVSCRAASGTLVQGDEVIFEFDDFQIPSSASFNCYLLPKINRKTY